MPTPDGVQTLSLEEFKDYLREEIATYEEASAQSDEEESVQASPLVFLHHSTSLYLQGSTTMEWSASQTTNRSADQWMNSALRNENGVMIDAFSRSSPWATNGLSYATYVEVNPFASYSAHTFHRAEEDPGNEIRADTWAFYDPS